MCVTPVREKLDAWLRDGGTIRVVPISAFVVAVLPGIIPLWLELGTFPRRAPRDRVGPPLLVGWIAVFLGAEGARRYLAKRATRPAGAAPGPTTPKTSGVGPGGALRCCFFWA